MRKAGNRTKYPGVKRTGTNEYRVRGKVKDPRTGKEREVDRQIEADSDLAASVERARLMDEALIEISVPEIERTKIGDYARKWLKRKLMRKEISSDTGDVYAARLEDHFLPYFGDFYFDALRHQHIQAWIDESIGRTWCTTDRRPKGHVRTKCRRNGRGKCSSTCSCARKGFTKTYSVATVQGWFSVVRNMTSDAVVELRLNPDPTMGIRFEQVSSGKNSLKEAQLVEFLVAMRMNYPQHYALCVMLAYTGLRFCHISPLRWEDWNEVDSVITVVRKRTRSGIGPLSRKKPAPKEYPVEPEIAEVLRWHRRRMLRLQLPGFESGYMFPSSTGTLRSPSSLTKARDACLKTANIPQRFTLHGMRYTFSNLLRRAKVDQIARRALTGHVTEQMQEHYENDVELGEKRDAVAGVIRLAPLHLGDGSGD